MWYMQNACAMISIPTSNLLLSTQLHASICCEQLIRTQNATGQRQMDELRRNLLCDGNNPADRCYPDKLVCAAHSIISVQSTNTNAHTSRLHTQRNAIRKKLQATKARCLHVCVTLLLPASPLSLLSFGRVSISSYISIYK